MKFRKKPVVVEATQWFKAGDHPAVRPSRFTQVTKRLGVVDTLEGEQVVTPATGSLPASGVSTILASQTSLKQPTRQQNEYY